MVAVFAQQFSSGHPFIGAEARHERLARGPRLCAHFWKDFCEEGFKRAP
jgi:hypothetical protein